MKATGIIRRIDDLGRVVIPKEIRRQLGVREGDPLKIYLSADGGVMFKKYHPIGEQDWVKGKKVVSKIIDKPFAIFDRYRDCQVYTSKELANAFTDEDVNCMISDIMVDGDIEGYLITAKDCKNIHLAVDVLGTLFSEY